MRKQVGRVGAYQGAGTENADETTSESKLVGGMQNRVPSSAAVPKSRTLTTIMPKEKPTATMDKPVSAIPLLARALQRIRSTPPRMIASPPTQPRRAAVALLIRVVPAPTAKLPDPTAPPPSLTEFFEQDWVKDPTSRAEILFLHRKTDAAESTTEGRVRNAAREAHVAFPGGRTEADDEGGLYTAMRQTWEEIGVDLAEKYYTSIGQLDDREITTSLGKRLLMILSPYVFLQVTPTTPPPDPIVTTTIHWIPLTSLVSPKWSSVTVDAASRIAPRSSAAFRYLIRVLVGSMEFPAIILEPTTPSSPSSTPPSSEKPKKKLTSTHDVIEKGLSPKTLKLWGLSLGMTMDLMSYMILPQSSRSDLPPKSEEGSESPLSQYMQLPYQDVVEDFRVEYVAPSLASVFPKFSYPDVNFWIWVFGKRYREVIRGWDASLHAGGVNDRRINWSGSALNTFYAAIRKALVVVIVARALGILFGLGFAVWWVFS